MDEFGQFLGKNGMLIVVVGGVGLGLVLLAARGSGGGSANAASGMAQANTAAYGLASQQVQADTQTRLASINAGVSNTSALYSFLTSANNAAAAVQQTLISSNAQIAQSQITEAAAIQIDQANNANRLQIANVNAGVSYAQIAEQSHASDNALKAVKAGANASIFSRLAQIGGSLAATAIML